MMLLARQKRSREFSLDDIDRLINTGLKLKWRTALRVVRTPAFEERFRDQQQYWVMRALLELLYGNQRDNAMQCRRRARRCTDYDRTAEGDFVRDQALALIRRRKNLKEAGQLLASVERHHKTRDRKALMTACYARLEYARGYVADAIDLFNQADDQWNRLRHDGEPFTEQWVLNSRFHWFKALAAQGEIDTVLACQIIHDDPALPRHLRARFIRKFGTLGNSIDDWIFCRLGR